METLNLLQDSPSEPGSESGGAAVPLKVGLEIVAPWCAEQVVLGTLSPGHIEELQNWYNSAQFAGGKELVNAREAIFQAGLRGYITDPDWDIDPSAQTP